MEMALGHLGWTVEQFWCVTLPEFRAAWRGYQQREQQADYRAGVIAMSIMQAQGAKRQDGQAWTPALWFPSLRPPPGEEDPADMIRAQLGPGESFHEFGDE